MFQLTVLCLGGTGVNDSTPLSGLTQLSRLELHNNRITDLTSLAGLTQLKELSLSNNRIKDVSPLAGLIYMKDLNLKNNHITDLTPLAGLTQLKWLYLDNNKIEDLNPLAGLTQLSQLSVDLNPLSKYPHVRGYWSKCGVIFLLPSDKNKIVFHGSINTKETFIDRISKEIKCLDKDDLPYYITEDRVNQFISLVDGLYTKDTTLKDCLVE
jgi:Leucine-rich repeat (LRR) protein